MSESLERFKKAAQAKSWKEAYDYCNSLNMFEMLRGLNSLGAPLTTDMLAQMQRLTTSGGPNMARIKYAIDVVELRKLPTTVPGDLQATNQLQDAIDFLAECNLTGGGIDQQLLDRTDALVRMFDAAIMSLSDPLDLRIFFTFAHSYITRKIRKHIGLFSAPNPLLKLNDSFATTFLKAVNGTPEAGWQRAFRVCSGLRTTQQEGFMEAIFLAPISFETCGACMAAIHINQDLRNALIAVQGVDPQDYGNVLIFVSEGFLFAEVKIRGRARGALMVFTSGPFMQIKRLDMSAKLWRNQVFKDVYQQDVPEPSATFIDSYHKGEGR
jgi:hypothetical protein